MEDSAIIELYWQRSDTAISESERKYGRYCRKIARNICTTPEDAEECVNDTWLKAWNLMPDKRPTVLSAFLGSITRSVALNLIKAQNRLKRGGGETTLALDELAECVAGRADPQREVEERELARALGRFVGALPREEKQVFILRYWYLAPVEEIAKTLGFSTSKTKSMLHRTRKKLKTFLEKEELC